MDFIKGRDTGVLIRVECEDGLIIQLMTEPSTEREDPLSTSKPVDCYVKHGRLIAKREVIYSRQLYVEMMSKTLVMDDVRIRMDRYWEGLNYE